MFNSLDEQMKRDEAAASGARERWLRNAMVVVVSLLVFGGLYASIVLAE